MAKELMIETIKAVVYAAALGVFLFGVALLAGCNPAKYEGAGFYNSGNPAKPVRCVEVRSGRINCETIK